MEKVYKKAKKVRDEIVDTCLDIWKYNVEYFIEKMEAAFKECAKNEDCN